MGIQFNQCDTLLLSVSFQKSNLEYSNFYRLKLKKTPFIHCELKFVDFTECDLTDSKFDECNLSGAIFDQTRLEKVDFRGSFNYNIDPARNMVKKAKFSQSEIRGLLLHLGIDIY